MVKKDIPVISAEKTKRKDVILDPKGFFVIEVRDNAIFVEYYANVYKNETIVSGSIQKVFTGTNADAICDTIAAQVPLLRPEHYLYLGRELMKAERALVSKRSYEQGGC